MQLIEAQIEFSTEAIGIFFALESQQFKLVVLLLLALHHCLFFKACLLQKLVFM